MLHVTVGVVGFAKKLISATAAREYYRAINNEELNTYCKEIEGILNWKPLTAVSSKSSHFAYLYPMSLLNSGPLPSVLPDQTLKTESIRKSWKTSQLMTQYYWLQL